MIGTGSAAGVFASVVLAVGCATAVPEPAADDALPVVDCASLGELECLASSECTLRLAENAGAYLCAVAADRCERGFVQGEARADDCPEGCTFVPARCYCAPGMTCVCGGGPPAACTADGTATPDDGEPR